MDDDRGRQVRDSAAGWQSVQLAVLGFIGLCGVLTDARGADLPRWLAVTAGVLILVSLVLACLATAMVASVAWPVGPPAADTAGAGVAPDGFRRRLRAGIALTFVAVAVLALAATSSWWPASGPAPALVELTTGSGVICGELAEAAEGTINLSVAGRAVAVPLESLAGLRPVQSC